MENRKSQRGVTLLETIVFIVVVSIGIGAFASVYMNAMTNSVDPVMQLKAAEKAQAILDEILSRRFDENSPVGGIPQCGSTDGVACAGISVDSDYDDVGDYNGYSDSTDTGYTVAVTVANAGTDLSITAADARLITVTVTMPDSATLTLAAYRVNF